MWGAFFVWVLIINVVVVNNLYSLSAYSLWVLIIQCVTIIFDVYSELSHMLLTFHFSDITQKQICCSSMTVLLLTDNASNLNTAYL